MFRSSLRRLSSWWVAATDDILGGDLEADPDAADAQADYFRTHPHRRTLQSGGARRPGTVAPRAAHCLTPVRASRELHRTRQPT